MKMLVDEADDRGARVTRRKRMEGRNNAYEWDKRLLDAMTESGSNTLMEAAPRGRHAL